MKHALEPLYRHIGPGCGADYSDAIMVCRKTPQDMFASDGVSTEFSSALSAKLRAGQITVVDRVNALALFTRLSAESFGGFPIASHQFGTAARFSGQYALGLRAGDALRLTEAGPDVDVGAELLELVGYIRRDITMRQKVKRRRVVGVALAIGAPFRSFGRASRKVDVMVLPVLHHLHKSNDHYSYDDVYRLVASFHPDQVGVEIRQEDLSLDDKYLANNYPIEMIHLAHQYGSHAFGFDWLGSEIAGRPIPDDWWTKRSKVKSLERSFDSAFSKAVRDKTLLSKINALSEEQMNIAKTATAAQLADGRYDRVCMDYYNSLEKLTRDTKYSELSRFYSERNKHLAMNVIQDIKNYLGRRIVVVTGADHHGPMVTALTPLSYVNLVPVPPLAVGKTVAPIF